MSCRARDHTSFLVTQRLLQSLQEEEGWGSMAAIALQGYTSSSEAGSATRTCPLPLLSQHILYEQYQKKSHRELLRRNPGFLEDTLKKTLFKWKGSKSVTASLWLGKVTAGAAHLVSGVHCSQTGWQVLRLLWNQVDYAGCPWSLASGACFSWWLFSPEDCVFLPAQATFRLIFFSCLQIFFGFPLGFSTRGDLDLHQRTFSCI